MPSQLTPLARCRYVSAASAVLLLVAACSDSTGVQALDAAKSHLAKGEKDKASIELKNALQAKPELGEARFLLGKLLLEQDDATGALVELERSEDFGVPPTLTMPLKAKAYLRLGQPGKVLSMGDTQDLQDLSAAASVLTSLAEAHAQMGEQEAAAGALARALKAGPDFAPALLLSAKARAAGGDMAGAESTVAEVLKRHPGDADALILQANLKLSSQDSAAARGVLKAAIAAQPGNETAHAGLLNLYLAEKDVASAKAQLEALRKAKPRSLQVPYYQAHLAVIEGRLGPADDQAKLLLKTAPTNPQVLQLAGIVAFRRGELEQAAQHLGQLLQAVPHDRDTRRLLARVQMTRGDPARALETLAPLLGGKQPDHLALAMAGEAQLRSGSFSQADELLARAVALQPKDADVRTAQARARLERGDIGATAQLEAIASADNGDAADLPLIAANVAQRKYDKALVAAERLVRKLPGQAAPLNLRGQIEAAMGKLGAARMSFEASLAAESTYLPSIEALARVDVAEKKPEAARARLLTAIKANPKNAGLVLALSQLDESQRRPRAEIVDTLSKAIVTQPTDVALRLQLVNFLLRARDFTAALNAAQAAVAALPNDLTALEALAGAELASSQTQQAHRSFNRLLSLKPNAPEPLLGLARAHFASGDFKSAAAAAQRALTLSPDHPDVLRVAAASLLSSGEGDRAAELLRSFAARKPTAALGDELLGDLESQRGRHREAAAAYQAAMRKMPTESLLATRNHGALLAAGDKARADTFADGWRKAHPKDLTFLVHLASTRIAESDLTGAESLLGEALRLDEKNAPALNNLAWVRLVGKKPGAVELAQRAISSASNEPAFFDTLALALAAERKFDKAIDIQRRAVAMGPNEPALRLTLAQIYLQAGDKEGARRELTALKTLGDRFPRQAEVSELASKL